MDREAPVSEAPLSPTPAAEVLAGALCVRALRGELRDGAGGGEAEDARTWLTLSGCGGGTPWWPETARSQVANGAAPAYGFTRHSGGVALDEAGAAALGGATLLVRAYRGGARDEAADALIGEAVLPLRPLLARGFVRAHSRRNAQAV